MMLSADSEKLRNDISAGNRSIRNASRISTHSRRTVCLKNEKEGHEGEGGEGGGGEKDREEIATQAVEKEKDKSIQRKRETTETR